MHIQFRYIYEYRGERRFMFVEYLDGAVNVTDNNGALHSLAYSDGVAEGAGPLAETHREAIAKIIQTNIQSAQNMLATIGVAP
jgi:hypothetical protein